MVFLHPSRQKPVQHLVSGHVSFHIPSNSLFLPFIQCHLVTDTPQFMQWLRSGKSSTSLILCKLESRIYTVNYTHTHTHTQGSPVKIQTARHQNPTGHSMITLLPVLSLSSVLPPTLCQCIFILARKNLVHI